MRKINRKISRDTLMVNEIFYSIQGESTHSGKPCVFVRLTYCNLRCTYCDTPYAFYEGSLQSLDEILTEVQRYQCRTVEVTGGEPLLQPGTLPLLSALCEAGYEVLLETSGSRPLKGVDRRVIKIVDFKCPSSGMSHKNMLENIDYLLPHDEVKFVMGTKEDYQWAINLLRSTHLYKKVKAILFSPVFEAIEPVTIVDWLLTDRLQNEIPNIRFQLQIHKFIWHPETRGV